MSGSGGTFEDVLSRLQDALANRSIIERAPLMPASGKAEAWTSEHDTLRSRLVETRVQCAKDIRESNRDTKWPTLRRCQRTRLAQEMTLLQKQRARINETPGTSAEVQTAVLKKADALLDALHALLNALDTGLFQSSSDLDIALQRLLDQYRVPWLVTLEHWRIERARAWMRLIVRHIANFPSATLSPNIKEQLRLGLLCLEQDHVLLLSAEAEKDHEKIISLMSQHQSSLLKCLETLRSATRLQRDNEEKMKGNEGSGATVSP